MDYFIGIDGGGTKTIGLLGNEDGEVLWSMKGGPTNYHSVGYQQTEEELSRILIGLTLNKGIGMDHIKGLCMGAAGVDSKVDELRIHELIRKIGFQHNVWIYNDGITALVGANDGRKGGVLISGTGSIAWGIDSKGHIHRVGGWGHLIDDVGSGYFMGCLALKAVMESHDGRRKDTLIWRNISSNFNIGSHEDLIAFIYNQQINKQVIASIAPLVLVLYGEDEEADKIIETSVRELLKMVKVLMEKIGDDPMELALGGSIFTKSDIVMKLLSHEINKTYPKVNVHLPYKNPAEGALLLAMEGGI